MRQSEEERREAGPQKQREVGVHRRASRSPRCGAGSCLPWAPASVPKRSQPGPRAPVPASMTTGRHLPGTRQGPCLAAVLLSGSWGLSGGGQDARPISSRQHLTPQHPDWRRQLRAGATAVTEKPDQRASHPDSGPASPCPGRGASRGPSGKGVDCGPPPRALWASVADAQCLFPTARSWAPPQLA